jgi:hypothetical protein
MAFHDLSQAGTSPWSLAAGVLAQTTPALRAPMIQPAPPVPAAEQPADAASPLLERIPRHLAASAAVPSASLDSLEWKVVSLARHESLASLRPRPEKPSLLARAHAFVFGETPRRPLANPKLEALRQLSVDAWHHGYAVAPTSLKRFRKAGFDENQLELLLATIVLSRGAPATGVAA